MKNMYAASCLLFLFMCANSWAVMPFPKIIATNEEAVQFIAEREAGVKEVQDLLGSIEKKLAVLRKSNKLPERQEKLYSIVNSLREARSPRYFVPPVKIAPDASLTEEEKTDFMRRKTELVKEVSENMQKIDTYETKAKSLAKRLRLEYPAGPQIRY